MRHFITLTVLVCLSLIATAAGESDPFQQIKDEMANSGCNHIRFLSLVESSVFETTDTVSGDAWLTRSGQYKVDLGDDQYLATEGQLYSFSRENNQVTVETLPQGDVRGDQLSFLTRLDEFYTTAILNPGRKYRLDLKDSTGSDLPVQIVLYLSDRDKIDYLEYLDVNEDVNRIVFLQHELLENCPKGSFEPDYPDSVEVIRLDL